jgi:hypothetical protein
VLRAMSFVAKTPRPGGSTLSVYIYFNVDEMQHTLRRVQSEF